MFGVLFASEVDTKRVGLCSHCHGRHRVAVATQTHKFCFISGTDLDWNTKPNSCGHATVSSIVGGYKNTEWD